MKGYFLTVESKNHIISLSLKVFRLSTAMLQSWYAALPSISYLHWLKVWHLVSDGANFGSGIPLVVCATWFAVSAAPREPAFKLRARASFFPPLYRTRHWSPSADDNDLLISVHICSDLSVRLVINVLVSAPLSLTGLQSDFHRIIFSQETLRTDASASCRQRHS